MLSLERILYSKCSRKYFRKEKYQIVCSRRQEGRANTVRGGQVGDVYCFSSCTYNWLFHIKSDVLLLFVFYLSSPTYFVCLLSIFTQACFCAIASLEALVFEQFEVDFGLTPSSSASFAVGGRVYSIENPPPQLQILSRSRPAQCFCPVPV